MIEPRHQLRPRSPRWTHIALRVGDIEESISWFSTHTPLRLLDKRSDEFGFGAWLGHPEASETPFVLVLAQFFPATDPYADAPREVLAPFAHLGIEMPTRQAVDEAAQRAQAAGCLAMPPRQMPDPIGYICMAADPDGNMIEFSFDQGVYETARTKWS
jgi:lactoylglutathione lyase